MLEFVEFETVSQSVRLIKFINKFVCELVKKHIYRSKAFAAITL